MTKSECFNYDWFYSWLSHSITPNLIPQLTLPAKYIADNFTRLYFEVDEDIVVTALQELGYECIYENGKKCFSISLTQKAHSEFETTRN